MKLLGKLRNRLKNKKGFTLVELIVVIVIIAILAALVVPALINYIDKAKNQQVLADARSLYIATQTVATEEYAKGKSEINKGMTVTEGDIDANGTKYVNKIATLGKVKAKTFEAKVVVTNYQVTSFTFTDTADGKKVTYDTTNNAWGDVTKTK